MASIFAGSATLSCRGFLILLILLSWRYITVVRRLLLQLLRRRVRFALRDLSPIFLLLLLLPSADLFQLYLTSPVRVVSFFGVFTALFLRVSYSIGSLGVLGSFSFSPIPVSIPRYFCISAESGTHSLFFGVVLLLLDARMGGVWSVLDPRVE